MPRIGSIRLMTDILVPRDALLWSLILSMPLGFCNRLDTKVEPANMSSLTLEASALMHAHKVRLDVWRASLLASCLLQQPRASTQLRAFKLRLQAQAPLPMIGDAKSVACKQTLRGPCQAVVMVAIECSV